MAEIDKQFQSVEQGQGSMPLVLYGMRGCGKSQLALSYCRKAQQSPRYSGVLWIDGTSLATVKESFVEAAQEMELMNWENIDHQTAMKGIFHLVGKSKTPWIVVFDNHDDLKAYDLHDFLPKHRAGSRLTIITSRSTETRQLGHAIKIGNLSEDEGLSLLLGKYITTPSNSNMTQGRLVIQRLGHLALAISQASAFILERNMDLNFFLSEYENEKERIHASLPALWRYERRGSQEDQNRFPLSIATTWELSLNLVSASGSTAFKDAKVQLLSLVRSLARPLPKTSLGNTYAPRLAYNFQPGWASSQDPQHKS